MSKVRKLLSWKNRSNKSRRQSIFRTSAIALRGKRTLIWGTWAAQAAFLASFLARMETLFTVTVSSSPFSRSRAISAMRSRSRTLLTRLWFKRWLLNPSNSLRSILSS